MKRKTLFLVAHLIQIFYRHVDENSAQRVLNHISCKVTRNDARALACCVSTLVKLWRVIIFVDYVDLYICCGAGLDSVDVYFRLSSLKHYKIQYNNVGRQYLFVIITSFQKEGVYIGGSTHEELHARPFENDRGLWGK